MKPAILLLVLAQLAGAQIASVSVGPQNNPSNQLNGSNGWVHNGHSSDQDTTRASWCPGSATLVTGNDGAGPDYVFGGPGHAVFVTAIGDFTTRAAGVIQTVINALISFGRSAEPVYGGGDTMKSGGIDCQKSDTSNVIHLLAYRQDSGNNSNHGTCVNDMRSYDAGVTWSNPSHIDGTTGLPTSSNANGDLPLAGACQFPTDVKQMYPIQYCMNGDNCAPVDGNQTYKYGHSESQLAVHSYTWRVLLTDYARDTDGTHYQWYKGTDPANDCQASGSWGVYANAAPNEPARDLGTVIIVSPSVYVPLFHRYIRTIASGGGSGLYQGQTPCGPWKLLYDFTTVDEGWYAPVLKSMTTVDSTTVTMNWLMTMGPPDQLYQQPNNGYNPIFRVVTFHGAGNSVTLTGGVKLASPITIH